MLKMMLKEEDSRKKVKDLSKKRQRNYWRLLKKLLIKSKSKSRINPSQLLTKSKESQTMPNKK
jgi:hypothetical protein